MRRFTLLLLVFSINIALFAQEEEPFVPKRLIFPIARLFEAAEYSSFSCWEPDWPLEFPPDAFNAKDDWLAITVSTGESAYTLSRDSEGRVLEFPYMFEGILVQARRFFLSNDENDLPQLTGAELVYGDSGEKIAVIEVLEYISDKPYLLRIFDGADYFFAFIEQRANIITEAWFDEFGYFTGGYEHRLLPVSAGVLGIPFSKPQMKIEISRPIDGSDMILYSYDSRSLKTGVRGSEGEFYISYFKDSLPRYWDRKPAAEIIFDEEGIAAVTPERAGRYSFQWDERDILVRFSSNSAEDYMIDSLYEYDFDERGNWTERRELKMTSLFGYLAAGPGTIVTRVIEYPDLTDG